MGVHEDAERLEIDRAEEWADWLARHHADRPGVWLVGPRRAAERRLDYEDAVLEALRFGWIDSLVRPLDEHRAMQWFSPRRTTSGWAGTNKARIARLEQEGRLEPAGKAAVAAAKANGSWTILDDVERLVVPDDLAAALDDRAGARAAWDGFSPSARRQLLGWLVQARRSDTRARRVAEIAEAAAEGRPRL